MRVYEPEIEEPGFNANRTQPLVYGFEVDNMRLKLIVYNERHSKLPVARRFSTCENCVRIAVVNLVTKPFCFQVCNYAQLIFFELALKAPGLFRERTFQVPKE